MKKLTVYSGARAFLAVATGTLASPLVFNPSDAQLPVAAAAALAAVGAVLAHKKASKQLCLETMKAMEAALREEERSEQEIRQALAGIEAGFRQQGKWYKP